MKPLPFFLLGLCLAFYSRGQSGLHINNATTVAVRTNTIFAVDGLVLSPTSDYSITGVNDMIRNTTLTHPSIMPAISSAYYWSSPLPAFSGNIGFYYTDAGLNGISEPELTLN